MDTISHALAGSLIGRGAVRRDAAVASLLGGVAAAVPDLDALFIHSRLGYIRYHRGLSHSFVMAPLLALAIAALARPLARRVRFFVLFGLALAGIVSHILLDWITSWGTMFFSPLSWHRYALDWVFIIDPFFTGILLAAAVAALLVRRRSRAIAAIGLVWLTGYIGLCGWLHHEVLARWRLREPGIPADRLAAIPQPLSPFRWMLIADRGDAVDVALASIGPRTRAGAMPPPASSLRQLIRRLPAYYRPPETATIHRLISQENDRYVAIARRIPEVAEWLRFARFAVARTRPLGPERIEASFEDVRFSGPWRVHRFVYRAVLSPDGRCIATGFEPDPLRVLRGGGLNPSLVPPRRSSRTELQERSGAAWGAAVSSGTGRDGRSTIKLRAPT
jgi:inner membrane protein